MINKFDEYVLYKALNFKYMQADQFLLDVTLSDAKKDSELIEKADVELKNISTVLPEPFFNKLNELLQDLEISKRRFVQMAIYEAYERMQKVVDEYEVYRDYPPEFDDEISDDEAA